MKNTFRLIPAVLTAIAVLAGCVQEITPPNFEKDKVNPAAEGSRVIAVSFGSQTKTYLDKDGLQPKFEDGKDTVLISNTKALDTCVVSVDDKTKVATITTNLTGPLTAVYPYTAAKMSEGNQNEIDTVLVSTEQSGAFADANICMAKMENENDGSLSFVNKTAVFCIKPPTGNPGYVEISAEGFDIANNVPTGSAITDSSTIHVNTTTADSVYVSILVPEGLKVSHLTFSDGTNVKAIPAGATADKEIAANTLYTVTATGWKSSEADIPGVLKGVFSVSAGKQVQFSQGNLYAKDEGTGGNKDWKWHFYEQQYQYNSNSTSKARTIADSEKEIDFFTWGYDGTSANVSYSLNPVNNTGITAHTTDGDQLVCSEDGDDWGVAYCKSNDIPIGSWRTLTKAEWTYLLENRTASGGTEINRYAKATVDTIAGIILLPDTYEHPTGIPSLSNTNTPAVAFTSNKYNLTEWEAMETAGAVFLPAAGHREYSGVYNVGSSGYYWSSTAKDESSAYNVKFESYDTNVDYSNRHYGYSVRLVTDVSAAPTPTEPTSEYVEIAADYDNNPNTANTTLKWYRQNLAITDSGNKKWKGGQTEAVKVPGTNEDVIVGDYFQWAASYEGYNVTENQEPDSLLVYTEFTNTGCGESEDKFTFIGDKLFTQPISPHYNGSDYGKYNNTGNKKILDTTSTSNDDVAHIILGEKWRMPTSAEFQAMKDATYWYWDSDDMGYYVYAPASGDEGGLNGKKSDGETDVSGTYTKAAALLFFPAAGDGSYSSLTNAGSEGSYWSSSLETDHVANAYGLCFDSEEYVNPQNGNRRFGGFSVRPVSDL